MTDMTKWLQLLARGLQTTPACRAAPENTLLTESIECGDLKINTAERIVTLRSRELHLTSVVIGVFADQIHPPRSAKHAHLAAEHFFKSGRKIFPGGRLTQKTVSLIIPVHRFPPAPSAASPWVTGCATRQYLEGAEPPALSPSVDKRAHSEVPVP
jgi:hypothetical protein